MTPKDCDLDFDFDRDFGFSTDSVKSADTEEFDLDAILARELGPDFDAKFEEEYAASQAASNVEQPPVPAPSAEPAPRHRFFRDFKNLKEAGKQESDPVPEAPAEAATEEEQPQKPEPTKKDPEPAPIPQEDVEAIFAAVSAAQDAAGIMDPENIPKAKKKLKAAKHFKKLSGKVDTSAIRGKLAGVGTVIAAAALRFFSALKACRFGWKMDKKQKRLFKDEVLPVLLGAASLVMCLIFISGSLNRVIHSEERQQAALEASIAAAEAEAAAAAELQNTLDTAARQAAMYDYQGAIATLDSYKTADRKLTDEMVQAKEQYQAAMADLVIWDDPTAITNLSFHVLIQDVDRAYSDSAYAHSYRTKFITTAEFSTIMENLYDNGYVLVTPDSFITATTAQDGATTYAVKPMYLPQGKTPIMITETLVNYFAYMVDGNGDGQPDADGAGFANKLVLENGKVKAAYIDAMGNNLVGDYDLVPILDTFVEAHPDFSYRGAKAVLAVTGDEGVFGWRIHQDPTLVDGLKEVVTALRATGYEIASNSYGNLDYGTTSANGITDDLDKWAAEIAPILGDVKIMVIARGGDIDVPKTLEGSNSRFAMIHQAGFHFIIDSAPTPTASLTGEYFYQGRLMVVGSDLASGIYDDYWGATGIN